MIVTPIKLKRIEKGLRQSDLADKANIPRYKYSFFENGKLRLAEAELKRIAKVLGTEVINPF